MTISAKFEAQLIAVGHLKNYVDVIESVSRMTDSAAAAKEISEELNFSSHKVQVNSVNLEKIVTGNVSVSNKEIVG